MSDPGVAANLPWWVWTGGWVVTLVVAYLGTRSVVNRHGNEEMAGLHEVRSELELMHRAQTASNQLTAQMNDLAIRRIDLVERRVDILEHVR